VGAGLELIDSPATHLDADRDRAQVEDARAVLRERGQAVAEEPCLWRGFPAFPGFVPEEENGDVVIQLRERQSQVAFLCCFPVAFENLKLRLAFVSDGLGRGVQAE